MKPTFLYASEERMNLLAAIRYLCGKGLLFGMEPNHVRLSQMARTLAAELECSMSYDMQRMFLDCAAAQETVCCYAIVRQMYRKCHIHFSKEIRAIAAIPGAWREFLRMTADQLNILLASDPEGEPFP